MSRCMECGRKDCCGGLIEEQLKAKEEECERYEKSRIHIESEALRLGVTS